MIKELTVLFVSALPVSELRGAIPLAIGKFNFPVYKAYTLSVIGNMLPVIPILLMLETVSKFLSRKSKLAERFFSWLFIRTKRKSNLIEKYGAIGLILFVAIPLPATGAWTGCVVSFLFGIRRSWASICIGIGVMIAGIIVTLLTKGIIHIL